MTVFVNLDFLEPGQKWPPDKARLDRYARNRLLLEGDHDLVFTGLNEDDAPRIIKMRLNWFKRICTLFGDLAVGQPPQITAEEQEAVDRITEANSFGLIIYDLIGDLIAFGDSVLKVRWDGKRGVISRIDPSNWFPVVDPDDVATFEAHVIAWGVDYEEKRYAKVEIHRHGVIEHKLLQLTEDATEIKQVVELATIPRYEKLQPEEETGVDDFLIIPFHNMKSGDGVFGLNDFKDIEDIVSEIERRLIRVSGTLDTFGDPWMCGPSGLRVRDPLTGEVVWASDEKYIALNEGETPPQILTWDASLVSVFNEIDALLSQLYVMAELSPAAFGETKSGLAESGSALKRLMLPTLAKVNRLRLRTKQGLIDTLKTCAEMEVASRMGGASELSNISIEWRSSLPSDPVESANIEKTRRDAGVTSRRSSIARLMENATEEDIDNEVSMIEAEEDMFKREIMA